MAKSVLQLGDSRSRFEVIGGVVFVTIFIGYLFWFGVMPKFRSLGSDGAVITMDVSFDAPEYGSEVNSRLSGSLDVPLALQDAAVCRSGPDWLSDIILNTNIVVATLPELVRAAELGASGQFDWDLVQDAEQRLLSEDRPKDVADALAREGWDRVAVGRYLSAREEPPSATASQRFVAYAAARNLFGEGVLRVIDTTELDVGAIRAFANAAGFPRTHLAGSDTQPRSIDPSACTRVLDELEQQR